MSNLILPRQYVQMAKPVVFWHSKKLDFIMLPASPIAPPPTGYERIECRHAHEVDTWSERLRRQEKRIREMTDEDRYSFEEPIRAHGIAELRKALSNCTDENNRLFILRSIQNIERKRAQAKIEHVETYMACEAKDNVAG